MMAAPVCIASLTKPLVRGRVGVGSVVPLVRGRGRGRVRVWR